MFGPSHLCERNANKHLLKRNSGMIDITSREACLPAIAGLNLAAFATKNLFASLSWVVIVVSALMAVLQTNMKVIDHVKQVLYVRIIHSSCIILGFQVACVD